MAVFINKGDAPVSARAAIERGIRKFEAEKAQHVREQGVVEGDPSYLVWAQQWVSDNRINAANNAFNHALEAYRAAVDRLSRYRLIDGRPAIYADPVDPVDGESPPPPELVSVAIDPLPEFVDVDRYDPETGEFVGVEQERNPAIIEDENERAAAQAVVDATPQDVKDFDAPASN